MANGNPDYILLHNYAIQTSQLVSMNELNTNGEYFNVCQANRYLPKYISYEYYCFDIYDNHLVCYEAGKFRMN